jgi:flagellar P-ring protein precursor FlgI
MFLSRAAFAAPTVRIKDIATLQGVRENQLLGIGLVTGLDGRGDSPNSELLKKALSNLMASFGFEISADEIRSKNCAVVMVSAEVPAFVRPGERIDLTVSSIGDARSLEGGVLLQTNLRAANEQVYAVAQGKVLVSRSQNGVDTVGTISGGAIVEREVLSEYLTDDRISVLLRDPDFVTAGAVASAIREKFENINVNTLDASLIEVEVPEERRGDIVAFIGELELLTLTPDVTGKVVIDAGSGVIIVGENVRIGKVAVSYKSINVRVGPPSAASWSGWGEEEAPELFVVEETASVDDLVTALQAVGLKTDAIIGIMQAIERAGALFGRLIVL